MTKTAKRSHKRKEFSYGDKVRVTVPGQRPFVGTVYSQYTSRVERIICVQHPRGASVGYLVRYVNHTARDAERIKKEKEKERISKQQERQQRNRETKANNALRKRFEKFSIEVQPNGTGGILADRENTEAIIEALEAVGR